MVALKKSTRFLWAILALAAFAGEAAAATCTSTNSGNWNDPAIWSCNKTPDAGDIVTIKNTHSVDLNGSNREAASLTIDVGGTLVDDKQDLTVSGNVEVNGTYDGSGNKGKLIMTVNGTTLSGTGTVIDIKRIQIDADVTIPAGSNLNLTLDSEIRVGRNAPATLTIDGTITGTSQNDGNRIIRLDNNNPSNVIINGTLDAPNSFVEIQQGGTVTNNGTVALQFLDGNGDTGTTWVQGDNSNLTLSQPTQGWSGSFNAAANGNTVTFNGTAAPFDPATYYNIAGTNVTCPHPPGITVLGSTPCGGVGGVDAVARYFHDTTNGVNIGFDGTTNVTGSDQTIPPIITASLNPVLTCPQQRARSKDHPAGLFTHSRWYLNSNYGSATLIGANPAGSARLRGKATTDSVSVHLYDYDPLNGNKVLIGSSPSIILTGGGTTTTYSYTISSADYTVPAGHRLMLEYQFNQTTGNDKARVYCEALSYIDVTETPQPVADYRMDEGNWSGTANEVADSSANALHGKAFLGASTAPGKLCNAGNFAANYAEVADNNLLDITQALTVAVWIKPARWAGTPGKASLMSFYSKDTNYEAHVTTAGKINWWWGTGNLTSAASAPVDSWTHVAMVYTPGSQQLYINGVLSASGTVAGNLPVNNLPFQIGDDQNFGGGTRRFDGQIDELKIFNKAFSQSQIAAVMDNEAAGKNWDGSARVCPIAAPHHLEILHGSGNGLTCRANTLTLKACADNAIPCAPYTGGVNGTLSASGTPTVNWVGGAGFVIPGGSSTVTKDVQVTTPGSVTFGVAIAAPAPNAPATCNFGAPACAFSVVDAGFLVSAPHHIAESASTLTVKAVKKADNSLQCVPAFANVAKTVNLKCAYTNPASGTLPVRVAGAALNAGNNPGAACDAGGANVALNFDPSGIATPTLQYADVGQMQVSASYSGTAGTSEAGLNMTGSGSFITAPHSFAFSGITAGPIKAGNDFSATVTARNAAGNATPNFGHETAPEGVTLTATLLAGSHNPPLANGAIAGIAFVNGIATVNNLSWSEVGSITLDAALSSGNYLGSGVTATGTSATVGAFIPDHFETVVVSDTFLPMPCPDGLTCPDSRGGQDGFVYSGQTFSVKVIAQNLGSATTLNYDTTFGLSKQVTLSAWDALGGASANPGGGGLANNIIATAAFSSGEATANNVKYTLPPLIGPTDLYLRASDSDASSLRSPAALSLEAGIKVINGRIKVSNAYGSNLLPLTLTATAQYYDGSDWQPSTTDSVTTLSLPATLPLSGTGSTAVTATPADRVFASGSLMIDLSAPGSSASGSAVVVPGIDAASPGNPPLEILSGTATFGIYKGNDAIIYQREAY